MNDPWQWIFFLCIPVSIGMFANAFWGFFQSLKQQLEEWFPEQSPAPVAHGKNEEARFLTSSLRLTRLSDRGRSDCLGSDVYRMLVLWRG